MPWILIQTIAFAVGLTGVLLLIVGLAGTRAGAGTRCRACGYDVDAILEEQETCPECGSTITGKRGTVSGARVRRKGAIVVGVVLLVPASAVGWYVSTIIQPVVARPTWLMAGELWLGPTSENAELARELQRRWRVGELSDIGKHALIDWGVSAWNGSHQSRNYEHASVVRFAIAADELSPSQIDRFVEQMLIDIGDDTNTSRQRVALAVARDIGTAIRTRLEDALVDPALRDAAVVLLLDELSNMPSEGLMDAAIEALSHRSGGPETGPALDRLPLSIEARRAVRYLTHHAAICAPALRLALFSEDPQRRLLAAVALTEAASPEDAEAIGAAVASAFEPNETPGDALLATRALLRAGPVAIRAADEVVTSELARARIREAAEAFASGALPPSLERLAGPLPWQVQNRTTGNLTPLP